MFHHLMIRLTAVLIGLAAGGAVTGSRSSAGGSVGRARSGCADRSGRSVRSDRGGGPDRDRTRGSVDRPDRGDVPGWVLITLMTAGLVVALWALAGEAFSTMFQDAMDKVRGAG
ncbi:hypothetical protein DFO66_101360 [Brevibacterium sanguinis]|uniref:Uncharacterized protein n=2 Tax=Brevibacterium TaxID=1696 RepID=A0A366IQ23_9MICO|nr:MULTISPECIES: hypothetical protein [Brevibacterium]RBP68132.1 hypothetical protein DFO66_101360 [Brevibacterium sanguinis]RBP74451.1 hypothetical protein DFO65_101169 [Brevibacterium celere]